MIESLANQDELKVDRVQVGPGGKFSYDGDSKHDNWRGEADHIEDTLKLALSLAADGFLVPVQMKVTQDSPTGPELTSYLPMPTRVVTESDQPNPELANALFAALETTSNETKDLCDLYVAATGVRGPAPSILLTAWAYALILDAMVEGKGQFVSRWKTLLKDLEDKDQKLSADVTANELFRYRNEALKYRNWKDSELTVEQAGLLREAARKYLLIRLGVT